MKTWKIAGIYKIVNLTNGHFYIGKTLNFSNRRSGHFSGLALGKHFNQHLQRAYDKHGKEAFTIELIQAIGGSNVDTIMSQLTLAEQTILKNVVGKVDCYNICIDSDVPHYGKPLSVKHRENISKAMIGKNKGRQHAMETRNNMSRGQLGKNLTEETRKKMAVAKIGNKHRAQKCVCVETGEVFESCLEASRIKGINPGNLHQAIVGKRQAAGGYHWRIV